MRHFRVSEGAIWPLSFASDGRSLVCIEVARFGHVHGAVHWLDPRTGESQRTLDLREDAWRRSVSYADNAVTRVAFISPDGQRVAVQRWVGDLVALDMWRALTGTWREIDPGSSNVVDAVCYSANSDLMLYTTGTDGGDTNSLKRLNLLTHRHLRVIELPGPSVQSLQLTPNGNRLAALNYSNVFVTTHDRRRAGALKWVTRDLDVSDGATLRICPDGEELVVADGPQLLFWDCRSQEMDLVKVEGGGAYEVVYSPDGRVFALGGEDGTVRLFNRWSRQEVGRYDWGIGRVASVAFAPDGLTAAAAGEGGQIVLWDVGV